MSSNTEEPSAKKQKRSLGASDRITVDVGGTKFITSVSTLTSNSTYFASLLSDNWIESNSGDHELFIDQDPDTFKVLLAYMREGIIEVKDINARALALAEFLGIEKLLLAAKVRWYHNIGKGPVHSTDEDIAAAFDQNYGGIMKAICSGLFPYFLKRDDEHAEKEYAMIILEDDPDSPNRVKVKEVGKQTPAQKAHTLVGAVNGLHLKGYSKYENQLRTDSTHTFSRRKHFLLQSEATGIFIPTDNEKEGNRYMKQFAFLIVTDTETLNIRVILAPAEFNEDGDIRSNPLRYTSIHGGSPWLEENGFANREKEYEYMFDFAEDENGVNVTYTKIYSRMVVRDNNWDESW